MKAWSPGYVCVSVCLNLKASDKVAAPLKLSVVHFTLVPTKMVAFSVQG